MLTNNVDWHLAYMIIYYTSCATMLTGRSLHGVLYLVCPLSLSLLSLSLLPASLDLIKGFISVLDVIIILMSFFSMFLVFTTLKRALKLGKVSVCYNLRKGSYFWIQVALFELIIW